jgi:hypothetical protein
MTRGPDDEWADRIRHNSQLAQIKNWAAEEEAGLLQAFPVERK